MSFAEGLHAESKRRAYKKKKKKRAQTAAQVVNSEVNDTQKSQVSSPHPKLWNLQASKAGATLKKYI